MGIGRTNPWATLDRYRGAGLFRGIKRVNSGTTETGHKEQDPGIWSKHLPLETETCFFILANALDVFMTYLLLDHGPEFRESNLVANYFLSKFGFTGLIYFKFALVAFVTVVAQVIAKTRPATAKMLLNVGTVIVGAVVCYSVYLWVQYTGYFG